MKRNVLMHSLERHDTPMNFSVVIVFQQNAAEKNKQSVGSTTILLTLRCNDIALEWSANFSAEQV